MPDPVDKTISFRGQLAGDISDLLQDEGFACAETSRAIVELTARLARYTEEGIEFAPAVYVCTDIAQVAAILPSCEVIEIGRGARQEGTALRGLKECAPLAGSGWNIYIERTADDFRYGVFGVPDLPFAITPVEMLVEEGDTAVTVVVVGQIANNCVEVRGARGNRRCFYFSAVREDHRSPAQAIDSLTHAITAEVKESLREPTLRFVRKVLFACLRSGHGSLVAVLGKRHSSFPATMSDSIKFDKPIELPCLVSECQTHDDANALARLHGVAHLMQGILRSDGISVFRCDGCILGYRAFIHRGQQHGDGPPQGGARGRAFESLKALLGEKVVAVFLRSHDGYTEFHGAAHA